MSINMPNKFENNLTVMKPGGGVGMVREDQNSISAENIMKTNISNIQANVNPKQAFHSRNANFIQIEQKG